VALLLAWSTAQAEPVSPRANVSLSGPFDAQEAAQLCAAVRAVLTQAGAEPEGCAAGNGEAPAPSPGMPALTVSVEGHASGEVTLRVRRFPSDPDLAEIAFSLPAVNSDIRRAEVVQRLRAVLAEPAFSPRLGARLDAEHFARRAHQEPIPYGMAARLRAFSEPPAPDGLGAAFDSALLITLSSIQYLTDPETNAQDWKLDYSLRSVGQKLTFQVFEFDDNAFRLNSGHAMSGTFYFLSARSRHLDVFDSFLLAAGSGLTWEMTTEFREVVSVNDVLMTPFGGLALGEALYQLSDFFRASDDTFANQLIADILGGPARLAWNRDHSPPGGVRLLDANGYAADRWHRIRLFAGLDAAGAGTGLATRGGAGFSVGADTAIVPRADYDHPGDTAEWTHETLATRFRARASFGEQGLRDLWIQARNDYLGYYAQHLRPWEKGLLGLSAYAGLGAVLEHDERLVRPVFDQMTAVGPVGASVHVVLHAGQFRLRTGAEVHPVFAQIRSAAWPSYLGGGGSDAGAFDVLKEHGYYYALGLRPSFRVSAEYRGLEAGLENRSYSLRGVDLIAHPASHAGPYLADERTVWSGWIAHALPVRHLRLVLWLDSAEIRGKVDGTSAQSHDTRGILRLDWTL